MQKILVIDDDRDMRLVLAKYLLKFNYQVIEASSGKSALDVLEKEEPDLILCDFKLGDMDGTALLTKIKEKYAHIPVIFITGYGDIKIAVEVMRLGAYDYVTKPLFPEEILLTIRKALAKKEGPEVSVPSLPIEKNQRATQLSGQYIFGDSPVFNSLLEQIKRVAPTNYSVIIYGETGSGKEGIAQEIHKRSKRKTGLLLLLIAEHYPRNWPVASYLVMRKGHLPELSFKKPGVLKSPMAVLFFLMKLPTCRTMFKSHYYG